jgi:hypothetical protein
LVIAVFHGFFYGGENMLKGADHGSHQYAKYGSPDDPIGYVHIHDVDSFPNRAWRGVHEEIAVSSGDLG